MKTKLLRIIRANFDVKWKPIHTHKPAWGSEWYVKPKSSIVWRGVGRNTFDLIVKMLQCIYPQGHHYAIMHHSRRFKQARRKEAVRVVEVACIVGFVALIVIAILNSCCGSGIQY